LAHKSFENANPNSNSNPNFNPNTNTLFGLVTDLSSLHAYIYLDILKPRII